MREMVPAVPAMSMRTGWRAYSPCSAPKYTCQSGSSSYIAISWPMMPFSFSTPGSVM